MNFIIPGKPIAKKRPRFARRGRFVTTYNDQQTEEGRFLYELQQQHQKPPVNGPLKLSLRFCMPRPKGHYRTGKNAGKLKDSAPVYHTSKPDCDNMIKFCLDCMNGIVWQDDAQVVSISSVKKYSDEPRTEICITELEETERWIGF